MAKAIKTRSDRALRRQPPSGKLLEMIDFFGSVPGGGDAYIASRVIHGWADEKAVAILRVERLV